LSTITVGAVADEARRVHEVVLLGDLEHGIGEQVVLDAALLLPGLVRPGRVAADADHDVSGR
jgi:hypothetical protein